MIADSYITTALSHATRAKEACNDFALDRAKKELLAARSDLNSAIEDVRSSLRLRRQAQQEAKRQVARRRQQGEQDEIIAAFLLHSYAGAPDPVAELTQRLHLRGHWDTRFATQVVEAWRHLSPEEIARHSSDASLLHFLLTLRSNQQ